MKYLGKSSLVLTAVLIAVLPTLVLMKRATAAGTAHLYLSPASKTLAIGDTLSIDIHEDSGTDPVNAVQANLTYSSNLTYAGYSNSSAFSVEAQSTGGGGTVTMARGTCGPCGGITGDNIVVTVKFTANSGGSAAVNFAAGSEVLRSTDNQAETLTPNPLVGGTYSITSQGALTLSPVSKSVTQGQNFDVAVYENSGSDPVNKVQANLSYNSSVLSVASITPNATAWPTQTDNSGSGGLIKIGRSASTPLTGNQLVATITFTGTAAGTSNLTFTNGTAITRSVDNSIQPSLNDTGTYTVTAASSGGGGGTGGGGGSSGGGGGSSSGGTGGTSTPTTAKAAPKTVTSAPSNTSPPVTATVDNTPPQIYDIKVTNLTAKSATISWQTSEPATSEVDYGLNTNLILSQSDNQLTTSHSININPKELVAHAQYYFKVKSTDAAGNQSVSDQLTFRPGGIEIPAKTAAIGAGAVVVGAGLWAAAAGAFKYGGIGAITAHHLHKNRGIKPIIVGGGTPPPPAPVISPQAAVPNPPQPVAETSPPQIIKPHAETPPPSTKPASESKTAPKDSPIVKGEQPETPGLVVKPDKPPK